MSNWITITPDDLPVAKVGALANALRTAALAPGQGDPAPVVIQTVVDRIRRKIGSHAQNRVDVDPAKIPSGLKGMAVAFVLAELKSRLEIALTDYEQSQISTYNADLNRIASGEDTVEQPDNPVDAPVQSAVAAPRITTRIRQFFRRASDGV